MNGILEFGLVFAMILFLLAIDLVIWITGTIFLLGLLGWHPPGWLVSPVAHGINVGLGIVGAAAAVATPILLDMAIKHFV